MLAEQEVFTTLLVGAAHFRAHCQSLALDSDLNILGFHTRHGGADFKGVVTLDDVQRDRFGSDVGDELTRPADALLKPAVHRIAHGDHVAEGVPAIECHVMSSEVNGSDVAAIFAMIGSR